MKSKSFRFEVQFEIVPLWIVLLILKVTQIDSYIIFRNLIVLSFTFRNMIHFKLILYTEQSIDQSTFFECAY